MPGNSSPVRGLGRLDPMHLWFLEYFCSYAIALVAIPLSRRLPLLVVGSTASFEPS